MTVECVGCGKEMPSFPFSTVETCIKCTLETKFDKLERVGMVSV